MTTKTSVAPLRVLRLGRAFRLTRALIQGDERESFVTQDKYP